MRAEREDRVRSETTRSASGFLGWIKICTHLFFDTVFPPPYISFFCLILTKEVKFKVKLRLFSLSNVLVLYILHLYEWFCNGVQGKVIYVKYTMYIMTLSQSIRRFHSLIASFEIQLTLRLPGLDELAH